MSQAQKFIVLMVVVTVGVWGCSQGDSKSSSAAARHLAAIKSLEEKCAALEKDCEAAAMARDQMMKQVKAMEVERSRMKQEVEAMKSVASERDELKDLVSSRTNERDTYQVQLTELRKGIRTLLGRVESSLPQSEGEEKAVSTPSL